MVEQLLFTQKNAVANVIMMIIYVIDVFKLCISTKRKQKLHNL